MQNQIQNWKETQEYQELGNRQEAFDIWLDDMHNDTSLYSHDINEAISDFEEAYQGHYSSKLEFGQELANEMIPNNCPEFLSRYFDYEQFTYDIFLGDYWFQDGYVFRCI